VKRVFNLKVGEEWSVPPPVTTPPLEKTIGLIRNFTIFTHTAAMSSSCPQGCKLCTKELKCFFMDTNFPARNLMGFEVVNSCPAGYEPHN
jgi:hypothetical protein